MAASIEHTAGCFQNLPPEALKLIAQKKTQISYLRGETVFNVITSYSIHYTKLYDPPQLTQAGFGNHLANAVETNFIFEGTRVNHVLELLRQKYNSLLNCRPGLPHVRFGKKNMPEIRSRRLLSGRFPRSTLTFLLPRPAFLPFAFYH